MDALQLKRQLITFTELLFREVSNETLKLVSLPCADVLFSGFLDEQFHQLQQLQDEKNPNFVVEVVSLFFEDSERLLNELAKALDQQNVDYKKVDAHVHQLKGSSSSIGAQRVQRVCIVFRNYCNEKNVEGCLKCLQQLKHEYAIVKTKLEALFSVSRRKTGFSSEEKTSQNPNLTRVSGFCFQLEQQILAAGG
ncbi:hypothetical protein CDL15_Pgr019024 [Punica granatum]|uniref:Histidine-containing phosphotransfer protein n=1 Tax=Punica granatum TaxID=22663 RepID=A0A218XKU5_PUNGR|nr:hypothetical protein CDL15_Pgr019024 [Punica granatum]